MDNQKRKTKIFVCEHCGKEFEARADWNYKYCSRKCCGLHKTLTETKKAICPICSKEFVKRRSSSKYCSNECNAKSKITQIVIKCDNCGKEFNRHKCHINENNFCSMSCRDEWKKENYNIKNHPAYNGGTYHAPSGYIYLRQPDGTYKAEHRIVAEEMLGRELNETEVVHHIDGNKQNNSEDNLTVMTREEHAKLHHTKHSVAEVKQK